MEIFQAIWTALTTSNEELVAILLLPLSFVEITVSMLLFTTILNINTTKKRKLLYVIVLGFIATLSRAILPDPYSVFAVIFFVIIFVKFILNATWLKSFLAEFIAVCVSSVLELFMLKVYLNIFNVPYESVMTVPLYRITFTLCIYFCYYILYRIIRYCKFHIDLENMSKRNKVLFFFNTILGIIAIGAQFYLIMFYSDTMPATVTIVSIVSLLAYFVISFYSLSNTNKLDTTSRNLEEAQLYIKTLTLLHDSIRGFKHDFGNIVQSIGGYVDSNNMDGLKVYYKQLLQDCNRANNLTSLSPTVINNPAIYSIMATKYHNADESGITINLTILIDLNEIEKHMKIYEFTRILGILMDNAIEASVECEEKVINVLFRKEETKHRFLIQIENTYLNKDIDTEKIYEKAYSTKSKKTNSGIGLWEVRQILKKNNNLNLFTTKDDEYFKQQFEIYY